MKILTENNVVVSYQIVGGGYTPNENQVMYEVEEIPEEVQNADIGAFCYSEEKGFYENPDYVPPETPTETPTETITDTDILNVLLGVNE